MRIRKKRYLFVKFDLLQEVKFRKLLNVSDRIYVLVDADTRMIPLKLARKMQRVGRAVRWIKIDHRGSEVMLQLGFLLGTLHESTDHDIEFAILTEDERYDVLVQMINERGRRALRVLPTRTGNHEEEESMLPELPEQVYEPMELPTVAEAAQYEAPESILTDNYEERFANGNNGHHPEQAASETAVSDDKFAGHQSVEEVTRRTIERLVRSGNRPAEIETLRHYIMFSTHEVVDDERVDQVIDRMQAANEIELAENEVTYHF